MDKYEIVETELVFVTTPGMKTVAWQCPPGLERHRLYMTGCRPGLWYTNILNPPSRLHNVARPSRTFDSKGDALAWCFSVIAGSGPIDSEDVPNYYFYVESRNLSIATIWRKPRLDGYRGGGAPTGAWLGKSMNVARPWSWVSHKTRLGVFREVVRILKKEGFTKR